MQQYKIYLPNGECVSAGAATRCAITRVQLTKSVNAETELMPGGVCSTMLEVAVIDPEGLLTVRAGDWLRLEEGGSTLGLFRAEKPERSSSGQYRITAYDAVSLLDQDLGQWLFDLPGWPYSLQQLAKMVCAQCGLELTNSLPINGDYPVGAFPGAGITGRQLMRWICQLGGCFCRARADGQLEFAWYAETGLCLRPTGEHFYYRDGLSGGEYATHPIEKVQLQLTPQDVGAVYPDEAGEKNTLRITGNRLLGNSGAAAMKEAARQLYTRMAGITYTPCSVRAGAACGARAGDVITLEDRAGVTRKVYVMHSVCVDGMVTLQSTGSARRDSTAAVNTARYESLTGQVLQVQADVEGLRIENADARGNLASLQLSLDGIQAQVQQNKTDGENLKTLCTTLQQTEESLQLQVQALEQAGAKRVTTATGYTFDQEGLKIAKAGQQMENLLDNTGMYVRRSGDVILQANSDGVVAKDVTVRNYLVIGDHARIEDYTSGVDSKRTACFFLS